jgi:hypothetical protein
MALKLLATASLSRELYPSREFRILRMLCERSPQKHSSLRTAEFIRNIAVSFKALLIQAQSTSITKESGRYETEFDKQPRIMKQVVLTSTPIASPI